MHKKWDDGHYRVIELDISCYICWTDAFLGFGIGGSFKPSNLFFELSIELGPFAVVFMVGRWLHDISTK